MITSKSSWCFRLIVVEIFHFICIIQFAFIWVAVAENQYMRCIQMYWKPKSNIQLTRSTYNDENSKENKHALHNRFAPLLFFLYLSFSLYEHILLLTPIQHKNMIRIEEKTSLKCCPERAFREVFQDQDQRNTAQQLWSQCSSLLISMYHRAL